MPTILGRHCYWDTPFDLPKVEQARRARTEHTTHVTVRGAEQLPRQGGLWRLAPPPRTAGWLPAIQGRGRLRICHRLHVADSSPMEMIRGNDLHTPAVPKQRPPTVGVVHYVRNEGSVVADRTTSALIQGLLPRHKPPLCSRSTTWGGRCGQRPSRDDATSIRMPRIPTSRTR